MSEQAKALELALLIEQMDAADLELPLDQMAPVAAELRRLHSVNAELLEALQRLSAQAERLRLPGQPQSDAEKNAKDAISHALGQSKGE